MAYLVDSNILVRLRDLDSLERAVCEQVVQASLQQGVRLYLCAQSLIEFWAVSTRPREANGLGLDTEQVFTGITTIVRSIPLLPEPPDIAEQWLQLVRQYEVKGKEVHDARLVAFAVAHQIRDILTLNPDDFTRYREVTAWTPAQLMEHIGRGG
jgi:predicted nucleic acid-binding protein